MPYYTLKRSEDGKHYTSNILFVNERGNVVSIQKTFKSDGTVIKKINGKFYRGKKADIFKEYNEIHDFLLHNIKIDEDEYKMFQLFILGLYPEAQELANLYNLDLSIILGNIKEKCKRLLNAFKKAPKSIKRVLAKSNILQLENYLRLKWIGLKDENVICKLLSLQDLTIQLPSSLRFLLKIKRKYYANTNVNPEIIIGRFIALKYSYKKVDILSMLSRIISNKTAFDKVFSKEEKEEIINQMASLKPNDLHDYLSKLYTKMQALNNYKEYKYSPEILNLECSISNFKFSLVKNTLELTELAEVMHNCVASYDSSIEHGYSIILYVENAQSEKKVCIELVKSNNNDEEFVAKQCFEARNKDVSGELKEVCQKYFSMEHIDDTSCYGYNLSFNLDFPF